MASGRIEGRAAVITGGGAGIGRAIAHRLASEGAPIAVADVNADGVAETVRQVRQAGGRASALPLDLTSTDSIQAAAQQAIATYGRIQILVNDAGVNGSLPVLEVTPEEWDRIFAVNSRGTFFCLQTFARHMKESGGGRIISISSIAAKGFRKSGSVAYAASKAAIIAFTRFAALHLGPDNVTVNAICPGPTRSDAFRGSAERYAGEHSVSLDEAYRVMDDFIPIMRSNEPADIAAMVAFLASDDARNITGQSYNVDGGLIYD
jgi:NAD(P)-dependent dehydrogenase (short-subunit alcohol dehydrogenase family)